MRLSFSVAVFQVMFGTTDGQVVVMSSSGAMLVQVTIHEGMEITTMMWSCEKFNMDESDSDKNIKKTSPPSGECNPALTGTHVFFTSCSLVVSKRDRFKPSLPQRNVWIALTQTDGDCHHCRPLWSFTEIVMCIYMFVTAWKVCQWLAEGQRFKLSDSWLKNCGRLIDVIRACFVLLVHIFVANLLKHMFMYNSVKKNKCRRQIVIFNRLLIMDIYAILSV